MRIAVAPVVSAILSAVEIVVMRAMPPVERAVEAVVLPRIGIPAIPVVPCAVSAVEVPMQRAVVATIPIVTAAVVVLAVVSPVSPAVIPIVVRSGAAAYQHAQTQRGGRSRERWTHSPYTRHTLRPLPCVGALASRVTRARSIRATPRVREKFAARSGDGSGPTPAVPDDQVPNPRPDHLA